MSDSRADGHDEALLVDVGAPHSSTRTPTTSPADMLLAQVTPRAGGNRLPCKNDDMPDATIPLDAALKERWSDLASRSGLRVEEFVGAPTLTTDDVARLLSPAPNAS